MPDITTYKPKKGSAVRRAFNFLSYFPNALGNFLLFRPINQTEIMKPYINDESIDLQDKTVLKELGNKLCHDWFCSLVPIPGLKELVSNRQRTAFRNADTGLFMTVFLGFAGAASIVTVIFLFTAGAPLLGAAALIPTVSLVGRIFKVAVLEKGEAEKIIKTIADKRAQNHKKRLAHLKKTNPLLN